MLLCLTFLSLEVLQIKGTYQEPAFGTAYLLMLIRSKGATCFFPNALPVLVLFGP